MNPIIPRESQTVAIRAALKRSPVVAIFALSLVSEATVNLQKLALSGVVATKPDSLCKGISIMKKMLKLLKLTIFRWS